MGGVTSFYAGSAERNLGAELEAVGASSDFFAGVLMANWMEGMTFGLGACIVTTKHWVGKIGGFEAIADMHSDDYERGHRIAKAGGRVLLSRETVWTMYPDQTARGFWDHQVRWARTVRLCRTLSYVGLIFTHGLPWALVAALVAPAKWIAAAYLVAYAIFRLGMAWAVGGGGGPGGGLRRKLLLGAVWCCRPFVCWSGNLCSHRLRCGGGKIR